MEMYLVYAIVYNYFVNEFPIRKYIDFTVDLVQFSYPTFWKHKASFFIYHFYGSFLRRCREILIDEAPTLVQRKLRIFLLERGNYILSKSTHIYGCMVLKERPSFYLGL